MQRTTRTLDRWWGRRFRHQAVVLLYHRVATLESDPWSLAVTPTHFAEHLEVLRRHTRTVALADIVADVRAGRVRRGSVALTFDDGYRDNLLEAKPLLERYDTPATVFVATGHLGGEAAFWWDELEALLLPPSVVPAEIHLTIRGEEHRWAFATHPDRPDVSRAARLHGYREIWKTLRPLHEQERERALGDLRGTLDIEPARLRTSQSMTADDLVALAASRLVEIGAHTVTHPSLATLTLDQQRREIQDSVDTLADITQGPVTTFSYPFGRPTDYTRATAGLVRELGLTCACANVTGAVHAGTDPYQVPRLYVHDMDGDGFARMLSQWVPLASPSPSLA